MQSPRCRREAPEGAAFRRHGRAATGIVPTTDR